MLQANTQIDPIIECLLLFYRRGLAIRQNSQPEQIADTTLLNDNHPDAGVTVGKQNQVGFFREESEGRAQGEE